MLKGETDDQAQVYADRNHLLLILRNIVNNAIKYTRPGDEISVTVNGENGQTKIMIDDTGIGMDEDTREKLFSLDGTISHVGTSGERGTGLGLVLVKNFVGRNNGSLSVSSKKDEGTRFVVVLPSSSP